MLCDRLPEYLVGTRHYEQVEIFGGQLNSAVRVELSRKAAVQIGQIGHDVGSRSGADRDWSFLMEGL
jgi:hypothetical protein